MLPRSRWNKATVPKSAQALVVESSSIIEQTIRDIHQISQVVTVSAGSIHEMETHSGEVATVINVIRDIADQTNLLALNAAIEAAALASRAAALPWWPTRCASWRSAPPNPPRKFPPPLKPCWAMPAMPPRKCKRRRSW
jgi:hypothetical protein